MALTEIVTRARSILYGSGLGERPSIRETNASAAETTSGQQVTFDMATGEAAKIKPGDILSVYDPDTELDAHVVYVLGISTDTITAINGFLGSPLIVGSNSGDMDLALVEQNAT